MKFSFSIGLGYCGNFGFGLGFCSRFGTGKPLATVYIYLVGICFGLGFSFRNSFRNILSIFTGIIVSFLQIPIFIGLCFGRPFAIMVTITARFFG